MRCYPSFRQPGDAQIGDDAVEAEAVREEVALLQIRDARVGRNLDYPMDRRSRFLDPTEPDQAECERREAGREDRIGFQTSTDVDQSSLVVARRETRNGQGGFGYMAQGVEMG